MNPSGIGGTIPGFGHPARLIIGGFLGAVAVGTGLLSLPWATADGHAAPWEDTLFTATSAVSVTGLITEDTGTYWSLFGQIIILALIQIGGLGIMTVATLVALLISRRLRLGTRLATQAETKSLSASDVGRVVRRVVLFSLAVELIVAIILGVRLVLLEQKGVFESVYEAIFLAISSFNNAGFALRSNNLMDFQDDPWVLLPIAAAVIIGGLGFPVWLDLFRNWRRPRRWSTLTRVTLWMTGILLAFGMAVYLFSEMKNPLTLGPMGDADRLLNSFFSGVMPRTAGFNSIDTTALQPETAFATDILMFIGGGSAGTAGGIKITTLGILCLVVLAQARGDSDVATGRRRISTATERQALTIMALAGTIVAVAILFLIPLTAGDFESVAFEVISAFSTVGLSMGATPNLTPAGELVVVVLMFIGRIGPLTVMSALALRERRRRTTLPEERMILG
ncbi:MAG: TrkH family potassium uptake protein [Actinobacteria bacterium]|nr:TrkH family potassium uptake protein [Actinomycetota bacterium]